MRPKEIEDDVVVQAGKELRAAGRAVTGYALRREVGGGSAQRLAAVWAQFVAGEQSTQALPATQLPMEIAGQLSGLLTEMSERLTGMAHAMNDTAVSASERRVTDLVRAATEQRTQAERELADADQAVSELEANLDQERQARTQLESQLQEATGQLQSREVELARLQEKHQADREEIERAAARIVQLEADVARLQREASEARDGAAEVRGELRAVQQQNTQLLQRIGKG